MSHEVGPITLRNPTLTAYPLIYGIKSIAFAMRERGYLANERLTALVCLYLYKFETCLPYLDE